MIITPDFEPAGTFPVLPKSMPPDPSAFIPHAVAVSRPHLRNLSAFLTAISVGSLAFATLGLMSVAYVGLGLGSLGLPWWLVSTGVAGTGAVAMWFSVRLGFAVWQYESTLADASRTEQRIVPDAARQLTQATDANSSST